MPTQLGKHFWPDFSFVYGLKIDYLSPTIYFTDVLIFFIALFSFYDLSKKLLKYPKNLFYLFLFIASLYVGVSLSKNTDAGYFGILKLLEYLYLGFFVYFNFKKINKKIIIKLFSAGILFEVGLSIFQYFNQGSLGGIFYLFGERTFNGQTPGVANASVNGNLVLRPYGTFSHPNTLAGITTIIALYVIFLRAKINKYFMFVIILSALICSLIALSRSSILLWLLLAISCFVITVFEKYKKGRLNSKVINTRNSIIGLAVLIICVLFLNSYVFQRFSNLNLLDQSIVQRKELTAQAYTMSYKNPVFGVGLNNFFNNVNLNFKTPLLLQPVHNIFLLTFSETGVIGLVALLFLFYSSIKPSISNKNKLGIALIISIIFLGSLDHYLFTQQQGQIIFTIVISSLLISRE